MIYFARADRVGLIKIGFTAKYDVRPRVSGLQVGSAVQLKVLLVMHGDRNWEKYLHERFSQFRSHGEWFRPSPELLDYIYRHQAEPKMRARLRKLLQRSLNEAGRTAVYS